MTGIPNKIIKKKFHVFFVLGQEKYIKKENFEKENFKKVKRIKMASAVWSVFCSRDIVINHICPYLSLSSIFRLMQCNKQLYNMKQFDLEFIRFWYVEAMGVWPRIAKKAAGTGNLKVLRHLFRRRLGQMTVDTMKQMIYSAGKHGHRHVIRYLFEMLPDCNGQLPNQISSFAVSLHQTISRDYNAFFLNDKKHVMGELYRDPNFMSELQTQVLLDNRTCCLREMIEGASLAKDGDSLLQWIFFDLWNWIEESDRGFLDVMGATIYAGHSYFAHRFLSSLPYGSASWSNICLLFLFGSAMTGKIESFFSFLSIYNKAFCSNIINRPLKIIHIALMILRSGNKTLLKRLFNNTSDKDFVKYATCFENFNETQSPTFLENFYCKAVSNWYEIRDCNTTMSIFNQHMGTSLMNVKKMLTWLKPLAQRAYTLRGEGDPVFISTMTDARGKRERGDDLDHYLYENNVLRKMSKTVYL